MEDRTKHNLTWQAAISPINVYLRLLPKACLCLFASPYDTSTSKHATELSCFYLQPP